MTNFNYTKRKSEGVKLGQIVAKDLRKRVKPCISAKAETPREATALDLNVEGKNLGDDGIAELARGLEEALRIDHSGSQIRLQTLNVSRNGLTVKGLAQLSLSIDAASLYLEELDVSSNSVSITTPEECEQWEIFLRSFHNCKCLLRLNLSGNNFESIEALETFARVYATQYAYSTAIWDANAVSHKLVDGSRLVERATDRLAAFSLSDTDLLQGVQPSNTDGSSAELVVIGLPSVQFLDLSITSLTDRGALFLSYVVDRHRWLRTALLKQAWGTNHACVIAHPNENLTALATRLLLLVDTRLDEHEDDNVDEPAAELDDENSPLSKYDLATGKRDPRRKSSAPSHQRKSSDTINAQELFSTKSPSHSVVSPSIEIGSIRSKLQRNIIENSGVESVTLWVTALKYLKFVRRLFPQPEATVDERRISSATHKSFTVQESSPFPPLPPAPTYASKLTVDTSLESRTPANTPRTPATPRVLRLCAGRKESSPQDSAYFGSSRSSSVASHFKQPTLLPTVRNNDAEQALIGPLPRAAWEIIIANLVDETGVLSHRHRETIMTYGASRKTLSTEVDYRANSDALQMWRVLEAMSCLDYETGF